MIFTKRINRDSIERRKPSTYGAPIELVPGPTTIKKDAQGNFLSLERTVTPVYAYTNYSRYSYEYLPCEVQCKKCSARFNSSELTYDYSDTDQDGNDVYDDSICPKCGEAACCILVFEELSDEECEKVLQKRKNNASLNNI